MERLDMRGVYDNFIFFIIFWNGYKKKLVEVIKKLWSYVICLIYLFVFYWEMVIVWNRNIIKYKIF